MKSPKAQEPPVAVWQQEPPVAVWQQTQGRVGLRVGPELRGEHLPFRLQLGSTHWYPSLTGTDEELRYLVLKPWQNAADWYNPRPVIEWSEPAKNGADEILRLRKGETEVFSLNDPIHHVNLWITAGHHIDGFRFKMDDLRQDTIERAKNMGVKLQPLPEFGSAADATVDFAFERNRNGVPSRGRYTVLSWNDLVVTFATEAPANVFEQSLPSYEEIVRSVRSVRPTRPWADKHMIQNLKASTALVLTPDGSGSGFVVGQFDDGVAVITNAHVASRTAKWVQVAFPHAADNGAYEAEVVAENTESDLALLNVRDTAYPPPPLVLDDLRTTSTRLPLFVSGFPLGLALGRSGFYPAATITAGWSTETPDQRALRGYRDSVFSLDVSVNPGNSGGPIVNDAGRVVGVARAHVPGTELTFAMRSNAVRRFLEGYSETLQLMPPEDVPGSTMDLPPEQLPDAIRTQVENALVVLQTKAAMPQRDGFDRVYGTGALVMGPRGELLVAMYAPPHSRLCSTLLHKEVEVVLFPGTPRQRIVPGNPVRCSEPDGTSIFRVDPFEGAPTPLALAKLDGLWESTPFYELVPEGNATSVGTMDRFSHSWRAGSISAISFDSHHDYSELRMDAGITKLRWPALTVNSEGALLGLARPDMDENLTRIVPSTSVQRTIRGAIQEVLLRYVHDGEDRCRFQFDLALHDPLNTLEGVGVSFEAQPGEPPTIPFERAAAIGPPAAEMPLHGEKTISLVVDRSTCHAGYQLFHLFTRAYGTQHFESTQREVSIRQTFGPPVSARLEVDPLAGEQPTAFNYPGADREFMTPGGWPAGCEAHQPVPCREACHAGNANMCFAAGHFLRKENPAAALEAARKGCELRHAGACEIVGEMALERSDWGEAESWLSRACQGARGNACNLLGQVFQRRNDGVLDLRAEYEAFAHGCELGDADSCDRQGFNIDHNRGVLYSFDDARKAFEKGCNAGSGNACLNYATLVEKIEQPREELRHTLDLLQRGCLLHSGGSCYMLARGLFLRRAGIAPSVNAAFHALSQGCSYGYTDACLAQSRFSEHLFHGR